MNSKLDFESSWKLLRDELEKTSISLKHNIEKGNYQSLEIAKAVQTTVSDIAITMSEIEQTIKDQA